MDQIQERVHNASWRHYGIRVTQTGLLQEKHRSHDGPLLNKASQILRWSDPYTRFVGHPNQASIGATFAETSGYGPKGVCLIEKAIWGHHRTVYLLEWTGDVALPMCLSAWLVGITEGATIFAGLSVLGIKQKSSL